MLRAVLRPTLPTHGPVTGSISGGSHGRTDANTDGERALGRRMTAWLVESYWPAGLGSTDTAAARIRSVGADVRLIGIVHVPADEMALWRIEAADPELVRGVLDAADVMFERIVEIVDLPATTPLGNESTTRREE
jgi:hypothetical protein